LAGLTTAPVQRTPRVRAGVSMLLGVKKTRTSPLAQRQRVWRAAPKARAARRSALKVMVRLVVLSVKMTFQGGAGG